MRADGEPLTSAELLEQAHAGKTPSTFGARLKQAVHITQWMPVVGALPATSDAPAGPPPVVFGLAGFWR